MTILNDFKFFGDVSEAKKSNILYNPQMASELILQVSGDGNFSISIYGKVDREKEDSFKLSAINMKDFSIGDTITKSGIYVVAIEGVGEIYAELENIDGKLNAYGKLAE